MNRSRIYRLLTERRQFLTYCLIGFSGVGLDLMAFTVLVTTASVHHQVANAVAYVLGTTNNFFLNVWFNFRTRDRLLARFLSFQTVGLLGLATSAGILWLLVDRMRIGPIPAKIATLSVVLALQYNLNRLISFRRRGVDAP